MHILQNTQSRVVAGLSFGADGQTVVAGGSGGYDIWGPPADTAARLVAEPRRPGHEGGTGRAVCSIRPHPLGPPPPSFRKSSRPPRRLFRPARDRTLVVAPRTVPRP